MNAFEIDLPARGGAMAALEFGPADRPPDLVFLHANGFNARTYRAILAPLAADLRILALDLRGHGASTPADRIRAAQGWLDFRDDLLALLDGDLRTAAWCWPAIRWAAPSSLLAAAARAGAGAGAGPASTR